MESSNTPPNSFQVACCLKLFFLFVCFIAELVEHVPAHMLTSSCFLAPAVYPCLHCACPLPPVALVHHPAREDAAAAAAAPAKRRRRRRR